MARHKTPEIHSFLALHGLDASGPDLYSEVLFASFCYFPPSLNTGCGLVPFLLLLVKLCVYIFNALFLHEKTFVKNYKPNFLNSRFSHKMYIYMHA